MMRPDTRALPRAVNGTFAKANKGVSGGSTNLVEENNAQKGCEGRFAEGNVL